MTAEEQRLFTSSPKWSLLSMGPSPAAENMALDEVLLNHVTLWNRPMLRFYSWSEPAATFGYFQKYKDAKELTKLRPLVRRPTGGGLVPHDVDWTYSLVFPPTSAWYHLRAIESYRQVHSWIREAFARAGVACELAQGRDAAPVGQCFVGAEQFDLVSEGRKIAGAAQRRTKQGLLIQGSIQPPDAVRRADWEEAFLQVPAVTWHPICNASDFDERVRELARNKYSQVSYNQRR